MTESTKDARATTRESFLPELNGLGEKPIAFDATALFFDVRESTRLINELGPSAAAHIFQDLFAHALRIVEAFHGVPVNFNGDGALALFTGSRADDHALRAAIEINRYMSITMAPQVRKMPALFNSEKIARKQFVVGVGLDKGQVYATRVGTPNYHDVAWTGRCTHTAARLAKLAPAHSVASSVDVLVAAATTIDGISEHLLRQLPSFSIGGQTRSIVFLDVADGAHLVDRAPEHLSNPPH